MLAVRTVGNLKDRNVESVCISTDCQNALSWILTGKIKVKNIFAQNKLKGTILM